MDTFHDIRHAWRGFRRSPGLAFAIVLTLALGVGANITVFSIADAVLLKMLPVPEPERLVQILQPTPPPRSGARSTRGDGFDDRFTFEQYREMQKVLTPLAELLADAVPSTSEAVLDGATETVRQSAVSGNYFRALGVNAVLGRVMEPGIDNEPGRHAQAVISHGFWKRRFAQDVNVIGRTFQIGTTNFEIIGVMEPGFFGLQVGSVVDVWTPISMETARLRSGFPRWRLIARLRPDVTSQLAMAPLQVWYSSRIAELLASRSSGDPGLSQFIRTAQLRAIPAAKGMSPLRKQYGEPIWIVFALVAVVLLLACANVSSLLLARTDGRQREMAVRLSIGASRSRILRQLFAESLLLAGMAAIFGTLAVRWTAPVLVALLAPSETPVQLRLEFDARLVAFLIAILVFTTIACGIVPALRASSGDVHSSLRRATAQAAFVNVWQSRFLLGIQMALSLVLLITSALFVRTLLNLKTLDPGFDRDNIIWAYVHFRASATDEQLTLAWQNLLRRVSAIPGVESASASIGGPLLAARRTGDLRVANAPEDNSLPQSWFIPVSPDFFRTFGRPLVKGRDFVGRDFERSAPAVVIVNETLARKFFGNDSPLGQKLTDSGPNSPPGVQAMEIVGVAADMKFDSLRSAPPAIVYLPLPQHGSNHKLALTAMGVALRTHQNASSLERALRGELAAAHPAFTLAKMTTQSKLVNDVLVRERLLASVGSFFGVIALLLAGLGLYGTMSYSVTRRTREIGIRMAVGACEGRVLRLILREALLIVAAGAAVGVPAAMFAARPIAGLLFGIEPQDLGTMLLGTAMLMATSLSAAFIPAVRASRTAPMEALRTE